MPEMVGVKFLRRYNISGSVGVLLSARSPCHKLGATNHVGLLVMTQATQFVGQKVTILSIVLDRYSMLLLCLMNRGKNRQRDRGGSGVRHGRMCGVGARGTVKHADGDPPRTGSHTPTHRDIRILYTCF